MLFEGEGTVCAAQKGKRRQDGTFLYYPMLAIAMTDEDPIRRFGAFLKGGSYFFKKPTGNMRKPQYGWRVYGRVEVERVFSVIRPWLSPRRIQQFEDTIAAYRASRRRPGYSDNL